MTSGKNTQKMCVIGSTEYVDVAGIKNIPAKIDTGADSSSIWVTDIDMDADGILSFSLLSKKSPLYTGERLEFDDYTVKTIRSSHGDEQIRYRVKMPLTLGGKTFETVFTLANRSRNSFPILIGKRTLEGNFLVDVSKSSIDRQYSSKSAWLNRELKDDPYQFHHKYIKKGVHL